MTDFIDWESLPYSRAGDLKHRNPYEMKKGRLAPIWTTGHETWEHSKNEIVGIINNGFHYRGTLHKDTYFKVIKADMMSHLLLNNWEDDHFRILSDFCGHTEVAIKIVNKRLAPTEYWADVLPRELQGHQVLSTSSSFLQFYKTFGNKDYLYIVTEFCDGGSLNKLVPNVDNVKKTNLSKLGLDEPKAKSIFSQVCTAVNTLHISGIIHRNITMGNILLDSFEEIRVK
ncbi:testis-specific serine/threonine-protein kinase 5, partial [Lingula anatina]|uniref:Testis-specific serine/threonine-protein kinase 5 n=1 Tax=Lingula anatina TaxID=7574 RepID=A0A2R2MKW5_LINAN